MQWSGRWCWYCRQLCIFYFSFSGSKTSLDRNSNNEHTICAEQSLCITNLLIELTQSPETIQEESCRQQTSCTVIKIGSKARKKCHRMHLKRVWLFWPFRDTGTFLCLYKPLELVSWIENIERGHKTFQIWISHPKFL